MRWQSVKTGFMWTVRSVGEGIPRADFVTLGEQGRLVGF